MLTNRRRPVAAIVPLKNVDRQSIALSTHPEFQRILERSRAAIAAGRTLALAQMRGKVKPGPKRRATTVAGRS